MPLADCVIDLLMDDQGYKYLDKVADRTNDVNQRVPLFSLAGPPSDTLSPMFRTRPTSPQIFHQKGNTDGSLCPDWVSDASQKLLFIQVI